MTVETTAGRTFTGRLDARTDAETLVLRCGDKDMLIVRPIDWDQVARIEVDGQELTTRDALATLSTVLTSGDQEELPTPAPAPSIEFRSAPAPAPTDVNPASDGDAAWEGPPWGPVQSLKIEAIAGKWSWGVENDGVIVRVFPLDGNGNVVPVNGTVEFDLIGQQAVPLTRGEPSPWLARWVEPIYAESVGQNGVTFKLPFQAWHPEFDLRLGSLGVVHARLNVPGQGVFDDTATMVRIRPYSSSRDRQQIRTRQRFFPNERTRRGTDDWQSWSP